MLTYEGQKPPSAKFHAALADWVGKGDALVVVDDGDNPYNRVRERWNRPPLHYRTPMEHLFEELGLASHETGLLRVGHGFVSWIAASPAALTYRANGADVIRQRVEDVAKAEHLAWKESNAFVLRSGPFVIAAGLDESVPNTKPLVLKGRFIDLFDPELAVIRDFRVQPGARALLFDLAKAKGKIPQVVAAACQVRNEKYAARL